MRRISAGLCAAMALLTMAAETPSDDQMFMRSKPTKSRNKQAPPTTFKGYALGMTLAAFKQRPAPPNVDGAARVACSDDPAVQPSLGPALTPRYRGEVVCGAQLFGKPGWGPGQVMLDATHGAVVAFHFFDGKLVQIETEEAGELSDLIIDTLTAQYGQPRSITKRVSRSLSNVVHTQFVMGWINGEDAIVLVTRFKGTDRMSVVYTGPGFATMQRGGSNIM
jgi:hypothetical protein